MYGCYRRDDASNPEIFADAAAAILADYPDDVIISATDPRTGLPGKQKWPPQPQEGKQECEYLMRPRRFKAAWEAQAAKQLAERAQCEAEEAQRSQRPTLADLKAKHGVTYGIGEPRKTDCQGEGDA